MSNTLLKLIKKYPNKQWDWNNLSRNINITEEFLENNITMPWNWYELSQNESISLEYIDENIELIPWCMFGLSCHPNMNIEFILKHIDLNWIWSSLTKRLDINIILKYNTLPWCRMAISMNPSINLETLNKLIKDDYWYIDYDYITSCSNIDLEDMMNSFHRFNTKWMTFNKNLNVDFIRKYQNTMKMNMNKISTSDTITPDIVEKNVDLKWNWMLLSTNKNITMDFILKYEDKDWDWDLLSCNPNITMKDFENNLDKPWSFEFISFNPNVTIEFIEKYIDRMCWVSISSNKFTNDKWFKNDNYIKYNTLLKNNILMEELMMKTWHPSRFINWCLDEDDKELIQ